MAPSPLFTLQVAAINVAVLKPFEAGTLNSHLNKPDYVDDAGDFEVVVHPDNDQVLRSQFNVMFAFDNHAGDVISTYSLGHCTDSQLEICLDLAKARIAGVFDLYRRLAVDRCQQFLPSSVNSESSTLANNI